MKNYIAAAVLFLANLFITTKPSLPELKLVLLKNRRLIIRTIKNPESAIYKHYGCDFVH